MVSMKTEKEMLVMGQTGTNSPSELLFICSTIPVGWGCYTCLRRVIQIHVQKQRSASHEPKSQYTAVSPIVLTLIEILSFWIPMIVCQTEWMDVVGVRYVKAQLFVIVVTIMFFGSNHGKEISIGTIQTVKTDDSDTTPITSNGSASTKEVNDGFKDGVTNETTTTTTTMMTIYRSCLILLTIISILAVDFPIFYPRKHVKTELSGYSLMDLGAASFVIAAGFLSSRARRQIESSNGQMISNFTRFLRKFLPLLCMGLLRVVTHKGIQYQEHVSEYGVHWNFFFTIAWLKILPTFQSKLPTWYTPVIILALYQILLSVPSLMLQSYIENAPRSCDNSEESWMCHWFFASNREGILGCISYSGLYLLAEKIAFESIWKSEVEIMHEQQLSVLPPIAPLVSQSILWTVVWQLLVHVLKIKVSRRTTNIPFCVWALVVNLWQLLMIRYLNVVTNIEKEISYSEIEEEKPKEEMVIHMNGSNNHCHKANKETLSPRDLESKSSNKIAIVPIVLNAFSKHGLIVFVLANILTGLINLSMDTISVESQSIALLIIFTYVTMTAFAAVAIDRFLSYIKRRKTDKSKLD